MKNQIVCLTAIVGLMVGCATSEERRAGSDTAPDVGTEFSELPAAVQNTIKGHAGNAKIDDIDKETRTGRTVYEITFAEPGQNPKLHVAENGNIVKSETINENAGAATDSIGTEFKDLPAAVQKTITQRAPNAKIDDIDKETRTGRTVYEVTFEDSGKNSKLHIAEDGTIVQDVK